MIPSLLTQSIRFAARNPEGLVNKLFETASTIIPSLFSVTKGNWTGTSGTVNIDSAKMYQEAYNADLQSKLLKISPDSEELPPPDTKV